jgi:hypothetical protein
LESQKKEQDVISTELPIIIATLQQPNEQKIILWADSDVCILHPNAEDQGIVVYHEYPLQCTESIAENGLLLGAGVTINRSRSIRHPYHFFRAPGRLGCCPVPAHPSMKDINANYFPNNAVGVDAKRYGYFCIRIDPMRTFVYSSESRAEFLGTDKWKRSRKSLTEYFEILERNSAALKERKRGNAFVAVEKYHLFSYKIVLDGNEGGGHPSLFNLTTAPPQYNAEILVRLENIPSDWQCCSCVDRQQ